MDEAHSPCVSWGSSLALLFLLPFYKKSVSLSVAKKKRAKKAEKKEGPQPLQDGRRFRIYSVFT